MTQMKKYEVIVEGVRDPRYIEASKFEIADGVAIFYDLGSDSLDIIHSFSPAYWNEIKLVE